MSAKRVNKVPFYTKMGYGVGALSYGIPFQMLSGFLVFYANSVLGISGFLTGILISVSIIWDAVTDPAMGYISDKTSPRVLFGRRLFYVMIGAIGIAITNYLLWNIDPALSQVLKAAFLGLLLLLLKTFSTVYTTPYLALGSELSTDYIERTSVQSFRTAFFFLGFLFPSLLGIGVFFRSTPEFANGLMNPQAYSNLGLTSSIVVLVCAVLCIIFTNKKSLYPSAVKTQKSNLKGMLKETGFALKNNDFRNISLTLLFVNMAMAIVGAVGIQMFTYTFGFDNGQLAVVLGVVFATALVSQPVWVMLAGKFEKRSALKACLIIDLIVSVAFLIYAFNEAWVMENYLAVVPLSIVMGFSMGGSIALPYAMISDTIDKDHYFTGVRKEGVFYGSATFMYKLSQAVSFLFVGSMLDLIGFNAEAVQSAKIYRQVGLIMPLSLLVCFVIAMIFTYLYKLDRDKVDLYQQRISRGEFENAPASLQDNPQDYPDR